MSDRRIINLHRYCRFARHQRRVDEPEVIGRDSDDEFKTAADSSEDEEAEEEVDEEVNFLKAFYHH